MGRLISKGIVNPEILKWARTTLNMSTEEVGRRLGKKTSDIAAWEIGESTPTYIQLERLAYEIYKRPIAIFFFPQVPLEDGPEKSFRTLPDFELAKLPSTVIQQIRRGQAMQLKLHELCNGNNPAERHLLKEFKVDKHTEVSPAAFSLREYLGISLDIQVKWTRPDLAFSGWRDAIESAGIFIFKNAFRQEEISGFCLYDAEFPIIYVNNSMPSTRQTFTLFHELAHLLMKTGGIDKINDDFLTTLKPEAKRVEIFCNRLAADFLVPETDFNKQIKELKITENDIKILANRYCVSREVIARKLFDREKVDQKTYTKLAEKWRNQVKQSHRSDKGGDYYNTQKSYLGQQYLDLVFGAYYRNEIDVLQAADYLNMRVESVLEMETRQ